MPLPACCLLAALFSSAVVEVAAGADTEIAVGRAPIEQTGPEENSVTFTLTPGVGLRLVTPAQQTWTLSYAPRIFYRAPNELDVNRPLVLHQVSLENAIVLSKSLAWASSASFNMGEIDYTASSLVFAPGSSTVRTSVADILRLQGETGFTMELNRRLRWIASLSGTYIKPLDDQPTAPPITVDVNGDPLPNQPILGGTLPESAQLSGKSSLSYALDRRNRLAANGEITYQWFPDTGRFLLLSPDITWTSHLSRRTTMSLSGGVAYVITLETPPGIDDSDAFGGTGGFELSSIVYKTRATTVTTGFGASLDWFFDPVAGTSLPRAAADAGTDIQIGREWLISPKVSFYAVIRDATTRLGQPAVETPDGTMAPLPTQTLEVQLVTPDATQLRFDVPVRYRLSNDAFFTFGTRTYFRGRSLTQDNFSLTEQYEFWAYVGLTIRFASGREAPTWLSL
jgi:hypothetical protein